jgi:hypothetical protein
MLIPLEVLHVQHEPCHRLKGLLNQALQVKQFRMENKKLLPVQQGCPAVCANPHSFRRPVAL